MSPHVLVLESTDEVGDVTLSATMEAAIAQAIMGEVVVTPSALPTPQVREEKEKATAAL